MRRRKCRLSAKHLLVVTTFGWFITFMVLINQLTPIRDNYTSERLAVLTEPLNAPGKETPPNAINDNTPGDETPSGKLRDATMRNLLFLRDNIMEVQYFLSNRRKDWRESEKRTMQELVNHLWLETYQILQDITGSQCHQNLKQTSDAIVAAINEIQQERDCNDSRNKLALCDLMKPCGFGCQLHHLNWCFIMSFALNRTLVLDDRTWSYDPRGWSDNFLPISKCPYPKSPSNATLGRLNVDQSERVITIPIVDMLGSAEIVKSRFLPSIPTKWAGKISQCHSAPITWYASHFIAYSMRPNGKLSDHLKKVEVSHNLNGTKYFGVHVRRSDKKSEARYHDLSEYMQYVDNIQKKFKNTSLHIDKQIYLATDEPRVLREETLDFPDYKFHGDESVATHATPGKRTSDGSLIELLTDIISMSKSQYLVCTFSSQVCRVSYELMHFERRTEDVGWRYQSLDDFYYYGGQADRRWYAEVAHLDPDQQLGEMSAKRNEALDIKGNHWDGFSKGTNSRRQTGLIPSFKIRPSLSTFDLGR